MIGRAIGVAAHELPAPVAGRGALLFLLHDLQELDFEGESRVAGYTGSVGFAIGELGRNDEFEFAADVHELETLTPTHDHSGQGEDGRLPAFEALIKDRSIVEGADVVDLDLIGEGGARPGSFPKDQVLQAALGGDDFGRGLVRSRAERLSRLRRIVVVVILRESPGLGSAFGVGGRGQSLRRISLISSRQE